MKLKLNKQVIENKQLTHDAIMAYTGVVASYKCNCNEVLTNKNMINYYLTQTKKMPRRFEDSLKSGVQELLDKHIIICGDKVGIDYYFDLKNIKLKETDKFVFADFEDIRKIMMSNNYNKSGLLRLYLCMISTFICKNKVQDVREPDKYNNILGMMSQKYFSDVTGLSPRSIVEYMRILEELEIIYVSRCSFMFKDEQGNIKQHNNIYGRYKDRDLIEEFVQVRYNMYDEMHRIHNMSAINNGRSLMQKYNRMLKGIEYDNETIATIYEYISRYNDKNPNKQKDMDIFKKYGYK